MIASRKEREAGVFGENLQLAMENSAISKRLRELTKENEKLIDRNAVLEKHLADEIKFLKKRLKRIT